MLWLLPVDQDLLGGVACESSSASISSTSAVAVSTSNDLIKVGAFYDDRASAWNSHLLLLGR